VTILVLEAGTVARLPLRWNSSLPVAASRTTAEVRPLVTLESLSTPASLVASALSVTVAAAGGS
jgi:hypothetical protein